MTEEQGEDRVAGKSECETCALGNSELSEKPECMVHEHVMLLTRSESGAMCRGG